MEGQVTYWFVFIGNSILLEHDDSGYHVPCRVEPPFPMKEWTPRQELPPLDDVPCMAYSLNTPPTDMKGLVTVGLRGIVGITAQRLLQHSRQGVGIVVLGFEHTILRCVWCPHETCHNHQQTMHQLRQGSVATGKSSHHRENQAWR